VLASEEISNRAFAARLGTTRLAECEWFRPCGAPGLPRRRTRECIRFPRTIEQTPPDLDLPLIQEWLTEYHRAPKRFDWTKSADMTLATIEGCRGA